MTTTTNTTPKYDLLSIPVLVAALGYFVDIYDLTVFGILRVPSLQDMGLDADAVSTMGTFIYNAQLVGLILGGIIWGVIGDKIGRKTILFGSILIYSIANILNGFVQDTTSYAILRFIAGIGLAGELGAAITLVAELVKVEKRSFATSLVTGIGLLGAIVAYYSYEYTSWRITYIIGGVLGLLILLMRYGVYESGVFSKIKEDDSIEKGNFLSLLFDRKTAFRYLSCIGIAIPNYFFFGLFAAFANEIGLALGISDVSAGKAVMVYYIGLALGDLISGPLSHYFKSRKLVIGSMLAATMLATLLMVSGIISSPFMYYCFCFIGAFASGYWAMFLIVTSETFGTNLRATATTSAPNMVRGSLILVLLLFQYLKPSGILFSATVVGGICFFIGFLSLWYLKETYNRNLDFIER